MLYLICECNHAGNQAATRKIKLEKGEINGWGERNKGLSIIPSVFRVVGNFIFEVVAGWILIGITPLARQ